MKTIYLKFDGVPFAKQSTKFARRGKSVIAYTPKRIKKKVEAIEWMAKDQLPVGFNPWDCPIKIDFIRYVFPIPKSMAKKYKIMISQGIKVYKCKKPDVSDNLNKGLLDALEGIVFNQDSRIVKVCDIEKVFGIKPMTEIQFSKIDQIVL